MSWQGVRFTSHCSEISFECCLLLVTISLLLVLQFYCCHKCYDVRYAHLYTNHSLLHTGMIQLHYVDYHCRITHMRWILQGGGFCISFIHNIQEVSLGFVVLCNIFFHHRSSKMANELRIFSSCKRIISSQHQIKEWWMNDEFVIIWEKVVMAVFGYCLRICLQSVK